MSLSDQSGLSGFQPLHPALPVEAPAPPPQKPRRNRTFFVAIPTVVLIVVVVIVMFANHPYPSPSPLPSSTGPASPSPMPGATTKIDIAPASVAEAIDLPTQPTLGTAWNATDGNPADEYLKSEMLLTPCEVLVSVLTSQYATGKAASQMVGYGISTGQKAWSIPLPQATGLDDPQLGDADPTYTPDCQMVLTFHDKDSSVRTETGLMIDLASGRTTVLSVSDQLSSCAASGLSTAVCEAWGEITVFSSGSTIRTWDSGNYVNDSDLVVDGMVFSKEGYRNPFTRNVVFGHDVHAGSFNTDQNWVVYKEPHLPGGLASGLAIRLEGPLSGQGGTCMLMAWDAASDQGLWNAPAPIPCGLGPTARFSVAGSVLVVSNDREMPGSADSVQGYSWADGSLLWQSGQTLGSTGWNHANIGSPLFGLTNNYVFFSDGAGGQTIAGITDGIPITLPFPDSVMVLTLTDTMAYGRVTMDGTPNLAAYSLTGPGDPLWTIALPSNPFVVWTVAINETMYLVYGDYQGQTWVAPLLE